MEWLIRGILLNLILFLSYSSFGQKLFIAMDDLPKEAWVSLKNNGALESKMIYGDHLYPNNSKVLVSSIFEQEIIRLFPNSNSSGICIIDWEGPIYENLINKNASIEKKQSAQIEFLKAIRLAKLLRPNVKWGFFGIPYDEFNSFSDKYIKAIYKEVDIISPAVYISSPFVSYDEEKMKRSAQIAKNYGKLFYPVIWDRFNTTNKTHRHKLLSDQQFKTYLIGLKKFRYTNKSIDGLIYWGRDTWFYGGYKTAANEAKNMEEFKIKYRDRVLKNTKTFFNSK